MPSTPDPGALLQRAAAAPKPTLMQSTQCCIVGGGPAGMMAGLLMARAGIETVVLEKHGDFLRDFRGDTVHPSTLEILDEIGLKDKFDALPQHRVSRLEALFADGPHTVGDFSGLSPFPYLALVPQWDLLDLLADEARRHHCFSLHMNTEATALLRDGAQGPVCGVVAKTPQGELRITADVVIGCDGRRSTLRESAGLQPRNLGAPMDVLWFRLTRQPADPEGTYGVPGRGSFLVLINRNQYWQAAAVIPKGTAAQWQAQPISRFKALVARRAPFLADQVQTIASWDDIKLLEVRVDRLDCWHCPGLLLIGDAAHAMSPIGGVGINLAIQDAVAVANILGPVLKQGNTPGNDDLAAVQARRMLPTRIIQRVQTLAQRQLIAPALTRQDDGQPVKIPALLRWVERSRLLTSIPARVFGLGFRREHVHLPARAP
ncbi:FAD-dependent oxidoreductase [Allopusillimonas soli]|nr:FAD-dependent oxidoreductase [Allopusillimonas soli]